MQNDADLSLSRSFIRAMVDAKVPAKQVYRVIALVATERKMSEIDKERLEMIARGY